jgi:hypothetical protein
MSKRFGRNQKRSMQQQINKLVGQNADLEHGINMANGLSQSIRRDLDDARQTIREVAYVLGDTFIGLPVQSQYVSQLMDRYRVAKVSGMRDFERALSEPRAAMEMTHVMINELQGNRFKTTRDHMRDMIHVRYVTPHGDWQYALSEQAWRSAPTESLKKRIAQDIAEQLAHQLINQARA